MYLRDKTLTKTNPKRSIKKIGVLGAGLMGHGIAYVSAASGFKVVMIDTSREKLERGLNSIESILKINLSNQKISNQEYDDTLDRIITSDNYNKLNDCNIIIEAVYEDKNLKEDVISKACQLLSNSGVFASNTSTIPISLLAKSSPKPENFIGLHFFSPVNKMKLVEIIKGNKTNRETLSIALDFVHAIGKEPIVVNDGPGFFTTRVFQCYTNEGMSMLNEGIDPALIEKLSREAGYPVGPLAILDEININLASHINKQIKKYSNSAQDSSLMPWEKVIDLMVSKLKRTGRSSGSGFYEYPENKKKYLWPDLCDYFPLSVSNIQKKDAIDRFYFAQALETIRCFEEGIISSTADANTGSILGWGFPRETGGILNFVNDYGIAEFKKRADELEKNYGKRFESPILLNKMAVSGNIF